MFFSHEDDVEPFELGDVPIPAKGDEVSVGQFRTFLVTGVKYTYRPDDIGWCHVTVWTVETTSDGQPEVFDEELNEWRPMTPAELAEEA